ncbi:MAG: hypothetical protein WBO07_05430 [Formosimonas sp.]|jgi:hypothetical protein
MAGTHRQCCACGTDRAECADKPCGTARNRGISSGGSSDAPAARTIDSLTPNYKECAISTLPMASVTLTDMAKSLGVPIEQLSQINTSPNTSHTINWLWAVLIGGVALLSGMVWVLLRQMRSKT